MARQYEVEGTSSDFSRTGSRTESVTQLLLNAAAEVFGENGFENARLAEIAKRSGLTTGAVYARWRTKRELFLAVVNRRAVEGARAVAAWGESSASAWLAAIGEQLLGPDAATDRSVLLEACVMARRDPTLIPELARSLDAERAALSDLIETGKAAGEIDERLSTEAIVFASQSLGLGVRLAAAPYGDRQPTEEDWQALMVRFIASIRPPAP